MFPAGRHSGSPILQPLLAIALVVALWPSSLVAADDQPGNLSGWQRLFRQQAAGYRFAVDGKEGAEVRLLTEPVLHWSQPVRGGEDGAVFLWVQEGRPIAIGALFIWPMNNGLQGITHELHSLSSQPFVGTWKNRKWTPPKDSVVWTQVSGAPAPDAMPEQRQRQMRDLSRQFKAESRDKNDRTWELRLLPRPIYRYELDDKASPVAQRETLDGAAFGFVEGTDLEVVLLLEARRVQGAFQWQCALARMSDFRLKVTHDNKTVWDVGRAVFDNAQGAYFAGTVESRRSADDE